MYTEPNYAYVSLSSANGIDELPNTKESGRGSVQLSYQSEMVYATLWLTRGKAE